MPDYDRLWKDIITDLFEEFLLFFAPELYEQIDFSVKPQSREQELHKLSPSSQTQNRRADKLIALKLKNGSEQWILVHIEVQGKKEADFPKRMFQYFYRALDKFNQKLYCLALFIDDSPSFQPNTYKYQFFRTQLTYKYDTYKILDQDERELLQSNNPFALAVLAGLYVIRGKRKKNIRYAYKRKLLKLLLDHSNLSRTQIEKLFIFIDHVIEIDEEETLQLAYEIAPLIEKEDETMSLSLEDTSFAKYYKRLGKEEGKEEGRLESKVEIARNMLKEGLPKELIVKITGLPLEEIEKL